jgi:hypothetical protein
MVAWAALTLLTACGGSGPTDSSALATFDGNYTITVGSQSYSVQGTDYTGAGRHEVIIGGGSALTCTVRLDFVYGKNGRPASEISGVGVIGFGGPECPLCSAHLSSAAGAPAPQVVVRNGRNEIDDGVLSGTVGFPAAAVSGLRWSLHAR